MKKNILSVAALIVVTIAGLTGCEWDFGGSADQTTEDYNVVNFAGMYNGTGGNPVVTNNTMVGDHPIRYFNVSQDGNNLRFLDSNGSIYEGTFGNLRLEGGGNAFAQFMVQGQNNNSGMDVTITGMLQSDAGVRSMRGTWLEVGGRTGQVDGITD